MQMAPVVASIFFISFSVIVDMICRHRRRRGRCRSPDLLRDATQLNIGNLPILRKRK